MTISNINSAASLQVSNQRSHVIKKNTAYVASGVFAFTSAVAALKLTALPIVFYGFSSLVKNALQAGGASAGEVAEATGMIKALCGPLVGTALVIGVLFVLFTAALALICYKIGAHYSALSK